jgi:putative transposase
MDEKTKRSIALFRLGVLGALVSARLEHGDLQQLFKEAAARRYEVPPEGRLRTFKARTIESWYYAHKRKGFEGLYPTTRSDRNRSRSIRPDVADLVLRAKREKPRRSLKRIIRMLERARIVRPGELARSSVHRLLQVAGVSSRPLRGPSAERRSFIVEHAGDLWVGDALHGPLVVDPFGKLHKAYLLSQIDNATRFILHSYFALSEDAFAQEYGFKQALLKYGLPRGYYVDRGPAYIAHSLKFICADLDHIHLIHAGAGDAEAKGCIERWHRTWREEVGDELPNHPLTLAELNAIHWAWLDAEYHARKHETTGRAPREHFLAEASELRPLPPGKNLDEIFLHRERRLVRKDGTVRWRGGFLEVRAELCRKWVELRFDPADEEALPRAFVDGRFVSDTVPLDRLRNASRKRRRLQGAPEPTALPSGLDPLGLIEAEHYRRVRPAGAPARRSAVQTPLPNHEDNDEED